MGLAPNFEASELFVIHGWPKLQQCLILRNGSIDSIYFTGTAILPFFLKKKISLFYVYEYFAFIYVHVPYAYLVPTEIRRECLNPWNWGYEWL